MFKLKHWMVVAVALTAGAALAKLPPPTPEEEAAAAAKKAAKEKQMKRDADALAKAQDRVAQRYRKQRGSAAGRTSSADMPKAASEQPGEAAPTPTSPPSAEAHSGQNK